MTPDTQLIISAFTLACVVGSLFYKHKRIKLQEEQSRLQNEMITSLRESIHWQELHIDALQRQLEAAERIIQRGLYDEETLRRK